MSNETLEGIPLSPDINEDFNVDLTEFATALKTFPENILKAVLNIYHKQDTVKKQLSKGFVQNALNLSKSEDKFEENDKFEVKNEYLKVNSVSLPGHLKQSHIYENVGVALVKEPHLLYAHHHLFNQKLVSVSSTDEAKPFQRVALPEDVHTKSKISMKKKHSLSTSASSSSLRQSLTVSTFRSSTRESNADMNYLDVPTTSPANHRGSTNLSASPNDSSDEGSKHLSFDDHANSPFVTNFRESIVEVDQFNIDQLYNVYGEDMLTQIPNRILSIYDPNYHHVPLDQKIGKRPLSLPYKQTEDKKILVVAENLQLDVGNFEPITVSMFLLDISTNKRISEIYHCAFNVEGRITNKLNISESYRGLLQTDKVKQPHAVFTVSEPSPFIYLVVYGEKVLQQGGIPDVYTKKPKKPSKNNEENVKQSVIDKLKEAYDTLEQFREPLFWSCKPLFKSNRTQTEIRKELGAHTPTHTPTEAPDSSNPIKNVGKTLKNRVSLSGHRDEDTYQKIREEQFQLVSGPQSFRKLYPLASSVGKEKFRFTENIFQLMDSAKRKVVKSLDGVFLVSVKDVTEEEAAEEMAFSEERPIATEEEKKDFEDRCEHRPKALRSDPFEIEDDYHSVLDYFHQALPLREKMSSPFHLKYDHMLYIYPDNCNFTGIGGKDARNITIRAIFRDSDVEATNLKGLPLVESKFSRTYANGRKFMNDDFTSVSYHQKYPQFFSQFKIQLPAVLAKEHHIVFEFYHVNCQQIKKKSKSDDHKFGNASLNLLGYSVLRLIEDESCLRDGYLKLPVYKKLVPNYLRSLPELETFNNSKTLFRFEVSLKSSTYPQDPHALGFLTHSKELLNADKKTESNLTSAFFTKLNGLTVGSYAVNLKNLKLAKSDDVLAYTPSLINLLIYCMANIKGPDTRASANPLSDPRLTSSQENNEESYHPANLLFESLLALVRGIYNKANNTESFDTRDTVLSAYIHYFFKNPEGSVQPVYLAIADRWDAYFDFFIKKEAVRKAALLREDDVPDTSANTKRTGADDTKNISAVQRRLRSISVFKRKAAAMDGMLSGLDDQVPVTVRDSLQLSWFLFDLIAKSLKLEALSGNTNDFVPFFTSIRSLQRRVIEGMIDLQNIHTTKKGGSIADYTLAQKVNLNTALFIRDLLTISLLPNIRETNFRECVLDMLEDYMLSTQIKISANITMMRLEFIEMLFDYNLIIEFTANSSIKFVTNFLLDVILKALKEKNAKSKAIFVLHQFLTKIDYCAEYQDEEKRDEISRIFMPFVENLIVELDANTKDMNADTLERLSLIVVHLFRNTKKDHWSNIWLSRTPAILSSFLKLMSLCILTLSNYSLVYLRCSCKLVILEIVNAFVASMRDKMKAEAGVYSHVLEETILFFVKFLDQNREDTEVTEQLFIPAFCELIKFFAKTISMSALDNRWKWAMGAILKFGEFPFKLSNIVYYECMMALMDPLEPRLQEYSQSVEKFTIEEDNEKNFIMDEKGQIKGATLDKLIERITSDSKGFDMKLIETFFLTYRSFTKPYTLMDKLIQRFDMAKKDMDAKETKDAGLKVTLRVSNAVKSWVDKYFHDFDNILICRLVQFLEETAEIDNFRAFCGNLKKSLSTKLIKDDEKVSRNVMFREDEKTIPIYPKGFSPYAAKFNLMEWSSLELARQITFMEAEYFKKIQPKECLSQGWAKKSKYLLAPNIAALTDRWNNMTYYVVSTIIFEDDLKVRKNYIQKFIEIGMELRQLNNMNGVTEIVSGLAHVSIHRLKKTWDAVDQSAIQNLKSLQDLCNQQQANKSMRDALKLVYGACIPPLSMYLKDLTFIEDGNPDVIGDGLVNVFKRRQIAQIIQKIKHYQQTPYPIEPIPYIRDVFHGPLFKTIERDEDKLWERSIKIEPREKKTT